MDKLTEGIRNMQENMISMQSASQCHPLSPRHQYLSDILVRSAVLLSNSEKLMAFDVLNAAIGNVGKYSESYND